MNNIHPYTGFDIFSFILPITLTFTVIFFCTRLYLKNKDSKEMKNIAIETFFFLILAIAPYYFLQHTNYLLPNLTWTAQFYLIDRSILVGAYLMIIPFIFMITHSYLIYIQGKLEHPLTKSIFIGLLLVLVSFISISIILFINLSNASGEFGGFGDAIALMLLIFLSVIVFFINCISLFVHNGKLNKSTKIAYQN